MNSPALPETLYECLVKRCILGNGLHNIAITGHMTNRPLTHLCATETKDVAVERASNSSDLNNCNYMVKPR